MGLILFEGLVMGICSGDLDLGVISYLWCIVRMGVEDIELMFNYWFGMLGLVGEWDFCCL